MSGGTSHNRRIKAIVAVTVTMANRTLATYLTTVLLGVMSLCLFCRPALAQQPSASSTFEKELGIQLFEKKDLKGAIEALGRAIKQDKNDAEAWYYLGAALNLNDDTKGARKALKKAIELRPDYAPPHIGLAYIFLVNNKPADALIEVQLALALDPRNAEAHYVSSRIYWKDGKLERALEETEIALKLDPNYAPAYLLKSKIILALYAQESYITVPTGTNSANVNSELKKSRNETRLKRFIDARDSLEKFVNLSKTTTGREMWTEQLQSLRVYVASQEIDDPKATIPGSAEADTRPRIIRKETPSYSVKDRNAGITGTVTLFLTLAFDGTIKNILIINAPSDGLAASAVQAARKIEFTPAVDKGVPVSTYIRIEYNFNIF